MKIYIIGMPGCGKSTSGRKAAERIKLPFFDLDHEIEQEEGKNINEIFRTDGEDYFRKIESGMLKNITSSNENFIMATGGGAPCFFDNMEFMNQNGITVYIKASVKDLLTQLSEKGISKRPLLNKLPKDNLHNELEEKLTSRAKFYEQARHIFPFHEQVYFDIVSAVEGFFKKGNQK